MPRSQEQLSHRKKKPERKNDHRLYLTCVNQAGFVNVSLIPGKYRSAGRYASASKVPYPFLNSARINSPIPPCPVCSTEDSSTRSRFTSAVSPRRLIDCVLSCSNRLLKNVARR